MLSKYVVILGREGALQVCCYVREGGCCPSVLLYVYFFFIRETNSPVLLY